MWVKFYSFIQHIIFDILLPTADTFGDVNFAISAFSTQHYGISCLMITPVFFNVLFNAYMWKTTTFDSTNERRFTWILVGLNIWPQYQIAKLLISIIKSKENWKERQTKIKNQISYIEPFIEAIPQYIISVCVYMILAQRTGHEAVDIASES